MVDEIRPDLDTVKQMKLICHKINKYNCEHCMRLSLRESPIAITFIIKQKIKIIIVGINN